VFFLQDLYAERARFFGDKGCWDKILKAPNPIACDVLPKGYDEKAWIERVEKVLPEILRAKVKKKLSNVVRIKRATNLVLAEQRSKVVPFEDLPVQVGDVR